LKFTPVDIPGVFLVDIEPIGDDRGFFARSWCRDEFASHGLDPSLVQCSISFNRLKATLRGMHYQVAPRQEAKLVRCTMGSIFDVVADLRAGAAVFPKWRGFELKATTHRMLLSPRTDAALRKLPRGACRVPRASVGARTGVRAASGCGLAATGRACA